MIRPASKYLGRSATRATSFFPARTVGGRRFISTSPPHLKSRSWKSSAARWGLAVAGIYYYNTSSVFAEQPHHNLLNPNVDALEDENSSPTLDALTASSRFQAQKDASVLRSAIESTSRADVAGSVHPATDIPVIDSSPADLEEEAEGQGAFNPETGEINWDCPCLGGMAHGPCGPEFKEAFSCFVYSTEEPKGMDCIDKFQNMQNCFRAHPDVYKGELEDDEELDAELAQEREELKNQIAERKAADKDQQSPRSDSSLDESNSTPPSSRTTTDSSLSSNAKQSTKKSNKSGRKTSSIQDPQPQQSTRVEASSEPHSGMSEEHEQINEGQTSHLAPKSTPPIDAASVIEDELVPKAAHDAKSEAVLSSRSSKKY